MTEQEQAVVADLHWNASIPHAKVFPEDVLFLVGVLNRARESEAAALDVLENILELGRLGDNDQIDAEEVLKKAGRR